MFGCCCSNEEESGPAVIVPVRSVKDESDKVPFHVEEAKLGQVEETKLEEAKLDAKVVKNEFPAGPEGFEEKEEKLIEREFKLVEESEPQVASPVTFQVTLEKKSESTGLGADKTHRGLRVLDIIPGGSVEKYNEGAEDGKKFVCGDFIIDVDGLSAEIEMDDMVEQLKSKETSAVKVVRPATYTVNLRREGKTMGISLSFNDGSSLVNISAINPGGAIDCYNKAAPEALRIRENDLVEIVRAGSKQATDSAEDIAQALKTWPEEAFEMKMLRLT